MVAKSENPEETAPTSDDKRKEAEEESKELNELDKGDYLDEEYDQNEKVRLAIVIPETVAGNYC